VFLVFLATEDRVQPLCEAGEGEDHAEQTGPDREHDHRDGHRGGDSCGCTSSVQRSLPWKVMKNSRDM
jgi:hypothetical protein